MSYDYISNVLTSLQLKRLSEHKYSSSGTTLLDPYFQIYWNWLVTKLPLWLAPNLLTIAGLITTIITSLILIYYSPDIKQPVPAWALVLAILGIFAYQTLDALDGKQARRTGSSSPLGELLDHGCDAITTTVLILGVAITQQLGSHPCWLFFFAFTAMFMYYCAHWQSYVSGTLSFSKFDVLECQWSMILMHTITLFAGPQIWTLQVPLVGLELKIVALLLCLVGSSIVLVSYLTVIFTGGVGKNGSTVAVRHLGTSSITGTSVLSPIVPITMVILPALTIWRKSPSLVFEAHPCLYVLAFSTVFSKYTIKLVVAHMAKWELQYLDSILLVPALLFLNQYFNTYINEYYVLWASMAYGVADLGYFCTCLCLQLCHHLKISLFRITPAASSGGDDESDHLISDKDSLGTEPSLLDLSEDKLLKEVDIIG